jgi:glutaredoxin
MLHTVKVYGLNRCPQTLRATNLLRELGIGFDFFDLDTDRHARAWVQWKNGSIITPTIMIGLRVLVNPTTDELRDALAGTPPVPRPVGTAAVGNGGFSRRSA